jgi:hypothetical protein
MKTVPISGEPPALPSSRPFDIRSPDGGLHQQQAPTAPNHLPPQLASAARMALAIAQGEHDQKRAAVADDAEFRAAADWCRGKSQMRILIELAMRLTKLESEKDNER